MMGLPPAAASSANASSNSATLNATWIGFIGFSSLDVRSRRHRRGFPCLCPLSLGEVLVETAPFDEAGRRESSLGDFTPGLARGRNSQSSARSERLRIVPIDGLRVNPDSTDISMAPY